MISSVPNSGASCYLKVTVIQWSTTVVNSSINKAAVSAGRAGKTIAERSIKIIRAIWKKEKQKERNRAFKSKWQTHEKEGTCDIRKNRQETTKCLSNLWISGVDIEDRRCGLITNEFNNRRQCSQYSHKITQSLKSCRNLYSRFLLQIYCLVPVRSRQSLFLGTRICLRQCIIAFKKPSSSHNSILL